MTVTMPSYEEWRVLILLWKLGLYTASRNASKVLNRTNARPSDLGELAEVGWIAAKRDGKQIDVRNDDQWWSHSLTSTELRLTTKGMNWLAKNPHTNALFNVSESSNWKGVQFSNLAAAGVAQDTVAWLAEKRLVTVRNHAGHPDVAPSLLVGHGQMPGEWLVKLTRRGEDLIGP